MAPQSTGCDLVDSALYSFTIAGTVTAVPNPQVSCCAGTTASFPHVGTYGPMGTGQTNNLQRLLVRLRFHYFNGGASGAFSGWNQYAFGDPSSTITISKQVVHR
jgi:hypothetical protein